MPHVNRPVSIWFALGRAVRHGETNYLHSRAPAPAIVRPGGRPRRFEYRDWWAPQPRYYEPRYREREREGGWERETPSDFSRAPPPAQKKPEATTNIVILGDANADWLAYGLEDAYSEKPEIS